MRFMRYVFFVATTALLVACGGAPSDSDIRALVNDQMKKEGAALAFVGVDLGEVLEVSSVKVLNKAEDGKNVWIIDVEPKLKFKKGISDFKDMGKQMALSIMFGDFKAGQETDGRQTRLRAVKGDKGWMLAEK